MTPDMILPIAMRWMHILAAITALGGAIYLRFVLLPVATATLDAETHAALRTALARRWQLFFHTCLLLFLVSGFYNFFTISIPNHQGQPLYHALFGIKFLLALVVFALGLILTSRKAYAEKFRSNAKLWLGILVAVAVAVVLISGVLKNLPATTAPEGVSIEISTTP